MNDSPIQQLYESLPETLGDAIESRIEAAIESLPAHLRERMRCGRPLIILATDPIAAFTWNTRGAFGEQFGALTARHLIVVSPAFADLDPHYASYLIADKLRVMYSDEGT